KNRWCPLRPASDVTEIRPHLIDAAGDRHTALGSECHQTAFSFIVIVVPERLGGQCVSYLLRGLLPAAQGRLPLSYGGPQPVPVALVAQPVAERGGEGSRVTGRNQLAGTAAIGGGAERFGQPADGGSDDRHAVGERFADGHAVGLRARRCDEQVGGGVLMAERRAGQDAAKPDA